jgi:hypothetical protein
VRNRDNDDQARDGADLEGLRADAADELEQEEAANRADASAQAYVTAKANRLSFEAHQKDQARADAAEDRARWERDEAAQENYKMLLETEDSAKSEADEDARAAGRQTADEQAEAEENDAENGEPVNTGGAYPVRVANEDEPAGTAPDGTTRAAEGEGTWPEGEPDETVAGSAGSEQVSGDGASASPVDSSLADSPENSAEPLHFEGTANVSQGDEDL